MSGACFICDQPTEEVIAIERVDRSSYVVPMCVVCLTETKVASRPMRFAHELIDARNGFRARHRVIAAA